MPSRLADTYFATQDRTAQLTQVGEILSCLDDLYLNKHLVFQIIELLIVRLIPELGEQGVHELMAERSVDVHAGLPMEPSALLT
jgi:hypothetical protein